jgi:hypothetical protein
MGPYGDAAIMVFNPGAAGNVTVDLSMLPASFYGTVPYDLLQLEAVGPALLRKPSDVLPLAAPWTVQMGAGEMRFYSGFSLGVFAPRQGKKTNCRADDQYSKPAQSTTLQGCFLECRSDSQCENVFVEYSEVVWMEKPKAVQCTLLGAISNPASACDQGTGTLVTKLPGARSCASRWESSGKLAPLAPGAPPVPPGPPCVPDPPSPPPSPPSPPPPPTRYITESGKNCYAKHGGIQIDNDPATGLTAAQCQARCDADEACDCVSYEAADQICFKRAACVPRLCEADAAYDVYMKNQTYGRAAGRNCYGGHGGTQIDNDPATGFTAAQCQARCDADAACDCVTYMPSQQQCWKRAACVPSKFEVDDAYDVYVKTEA